MQMLMSLFTGQPCQPAATSPNNLLLTSDETKKSKKPKKAKKAQKKSQKSQKKVNKKFCKIIIQQETSIQRQ
jgi:hypothetical protein